MKRVLLVLAMCMVSVFGLTAPVAADHILWDDGKDYRWTTTGASPQVSVDCAIVGGAACTYVDAAIGEWTRAGFHRGLVRTGAADCTLGVAPAVGTIKMCQNLLGESKTDCPNSGDPALAEDARRKGLSVGRPMKTSGITSGGSAVYGCAWLFFTHDTRIASSLIRLCSNCTGMNATKWQNTVTHEMGHSLGLWHTADDTSIMGRTVLGTELEPVKYHEREVIRDKYHDVLPEQFEQANSGPVADVQNASTENGAIIQLWPRNLSVAQDFRPVSNGDGTFFIYNSNSAKALDVYGASTADNTDIVQWSLTRGDNQKVRFVNVTNGYQIKFEHSGKCLGTLGDATAQGTKLVQRPCTASSTTWFRGPTAAPSDLTGSGGNEADGRSDPAVFRPATAATWLIKGPFTGDSRSAAWGTTGDAPVAADYDGDHDPDIAVYRPSNGYWYLPNNVTVQLGGNSGDIPVPGDYDGDGDAEPAIFRPLTGEWLVQGQATVIFGINGDVPVPAHYWRADGARKVTRAVFRPSISTWFLETGITQQYGTSGDIPVPGDYNGDADADIAVFRPSSGDWLVYASAGSTTFGTNGDVPVPGYWDNDTIIDVAVYRPSSGYWFVQDGITVQYGTTGDIPVTLPYAIYDAYF